jgi:hypothetical protein
MTTANKLYTDSNHQPTGETPVALSSLNLLLLPRILLAGMAIAVLM